MTFQIFDDDEEFYKYLKEYMMNNYDVIFHVEFMI